MDNPTANVNQSQLSSPLLRLPAELRNAIYAYVINPDITEIWKLHEIGFERHPRKRKLRAVSGADRIMQRAEQQKRAERYLALPLVCRQMYGETRLLPLSSHTFDFNSTRLFRFVKGLDDEQRDAVRKISVAFFLNRRRGYRMYLGHDYLLEIQEEFGEAIGALRKLEKIEISFVYSRLSISLGQDKRRMRRLLKEARALMKEIVRQQIGHSVYVCFPEEHWETLSEAEAHAQYRPLRWVESASEGDD